MSHADCQPEEENELRQRIVDQCKWLSSQNLNQVTTGNVSVRLGTGRAIDRTGVDSGAKLLPTIRSNSAQLGTENETCLNSRPVSTGQFSQQILITPSGQSYASLSSEMIVKMNLQGVWEGDHIPSSEWRFHVDILKARPEVNAVVHTHSMFATIQSMTREGIPACHYLLAMLGGDIRCAPYARFGSQPLSNNAVAALEGRMACLLSNHGAIAVGKSLQEAIDNAVLLETLSHQYYFAKLAGVCLLSESEISETRIAINELPAYIERITPKPTRRGT